MGEQHRVEPGASRVDGAISQLGHDRVAAIATNTEARTASSVGRHADPTEPAGSGRGAVLAGAVLLVGAYLAVTLLMVVWMHAGMGWSWPRSVGFGLTWLVVLAVLRYTRRCWASRGA